MKHADLIRRIVDDGAVLVRCRGGHDIYRNVITGARSPLHGIEKSRSGLLGQSSSGLRQKKTPKEFESKIHPPVLCCHRWQNGSYERSSNRTARALTRTSSTAPAREARAVRCVITTIVQDSIPNFVTIPISLDGLIGDYQL